MKKAIVLGGLCALVLAGSLSAAGLSKPLSGGVEYYALEADTVVYAVHKGSFGSVNETYARLVELTDTMGIQRSNDDGLLVYLNRAADGKDNLIEVRLSVDPSALTIDPADLDFGAKVGGLGAAGIKATSGFSVASIGKPLGVNDPTALWNKLYAAVGFRGLAVIEAPMEFFEDAAETGGCCELAEIQTLLMVPVGKAR